MAALDDADNGTDMKSLTKRHLMQDVINEATNGCDGWLVLVVDAVATRVLSSVVKMYDIMENRITLVSIVLVFLCELDAGSPALHPSTHRAFTFTDPARPVDREPAEEAAAIPRDGGHLPHLADHSLP